MTPSLVSAARFWTTAVELGFLTSEKAERLQAIAKTAEVPTSTALKSGALTIEQCDIVETLLKPADVAPGYEILSFIGYGGMGVVYRARQIKLNRVVALKTILLHRLGEGVAAQRFEQEAVAIGKLIHPHIVAAYDFGSHAGRLYLVMELVDGTDAESWLAKQGSFNELAAWHLMRQTATGLAHAASLGIVHRDIKPANLLLLAAPAGFSKIPGLPMVKIVDFGLAVFTHGEDLRTRLTTQGSAVGSPHYMAPEQFDATPIDHRADIYALGATAFHLLAGRAPWSSLGLHQIMAKKLGYDAPSIREIRPDISESGALLIAAMLRRRREERPQTYDDLLRRMDDVLADVDRFTNLATCVDLPKNLLQSGNAPTLVLQVEPTRVDRPAPEKPRRRMMLIGIALMVAGVLASSALVAVLMRRPEVARELKPNGATLPLFDGRYLNPPKWRIEAGQWSPKQTEEDGYVLEGEAGGVIARRLERVGGEFPTHFRVQLVVRPNANASAEIQFDEATVDRTRYVVRVDRNQAFLGRTNANGTTIEDSRSLNLEPNDQSPLIALVIERQSDGWLAFVNDARLGCVPHLVGESAPEFRLKAIGGSVLFFDLEQTPIGRSEKD